jgi:hypothetical protein
MIFFLDFDPKIYLMRERIYEQVIVSSLAEKLNNGKFE